eukprot:6302746-Alexandrium_andersonii.AAC.1
MLRYSVLCWRDCCRFRRHEVPGPTLLACIVVCELQVLRRHGVSYACLRALARRGVRVTVSSRAET